LDLMSGSSGNIFDRLLQLGLATAALDLTLDKRTYKGSEHHRCGACSHCGPGRRTAIWPDVPVGLIVLSMGGERLDTRNPTSKLMLTILAGVATWEREIMLERQREGIAKAKAEGKYKGRSGAQHGGPLGRPNKGGPERNALGAAEAKRQEETSPLLWLTAASRGKRRAGNRPLRTEGASIPAFGGPLAPVADPAERRQAVGCASFVQARPDAGRSSRAANRRESAAHFCSHHRA
jgi:Resolvase, N terminal domain